MTTDIPAHDPVPFQPRPTTVFAQWQPGTFVENLAPGPDEHWYVTIPSHRRIDRVAPDGHAETIAELDEPASGIVVLGDDVYAVSGPMGSAGWQLLRIRPEPGTGRVTSVCALPDLIFGNGMTWTGDRLLIADSAAGRVVAVDPHTGDSEIWLQHELLGTRNPASPLPGANGIALHDGAAYLTNTDRALILAHPLDASRSSAIPEIVERRLRGDDLAVDTDGALYVATHDQNSVLRVGSDRTRVDIAGAEQGATGSTAVALGQPGQLHVTTTGGVLAPRNGVVEPARLLRIDL